MSFVSTADAFWADLWNRHAGIELAGLVGFVVGLGGALFANLPIALGGFGVLALAETDVNADWAVVTVPLGVGLIGAGVTAFLVH